MDLATTAKGQSSEGGHNYRIPIDIMVIWEKQVNSQF